MKCIVVIALISVSLNSQNAYKQEDAIIRSDIDSYNATIVEINKKVKHIQAKMSADTLAFDKYKSDYLLRLRRIKAERDTLKADIRKLQEKGNALSVRANAIDAGRNNNRIKNKIIRDEILDYSAALKHKIEEIGYFNLSKHILALQFLESEILAGTVDNVEAFERYWHIVRRIIDESHIVETWSASSPTKLITGIVFYLRLGYAWVGCVTDDGTKGALWIDNETGWEILTDTKEIAALRKGVDLASGKAIPELVSLPFYHFVKVIENGDSNE